MADRSGDRPPARQRLKTLTQAALNADQTVEQVEDVLDGLSTSLKQLNSSLDALNTTVERMEGALNHLDRTLSSLDDLAKRLLGVLQPVEAILERMDNIVSWGETMMTPINVTEHMMRGVLDRLRNRSV